MHPFTQATYNRYARSTKSGTRFEQAILPCTSLNQNGLQRVLLTSYDVDINWLVPFFPRGVPVTFIGNPPRGDPALDPSIPSPGLYPGDDLPDWEMGIPRKPHPRALQHIKLLMLFYDTHLRVIVSTGNLTFLDWSRNENVSCTTHRRCCMYKISPPSAPARR